jgi:hypothetical protein
MKKKKPEVEDFNALIFTRICEICRKEVSGERLWRKRKNMVIGTAESHRYICKECIPSEAQAKRAFSNPEIYKETVKEILRRKNV